MEEGVHDATSTNFPLFDSLNIKKFDNDIFSKVTVTVKVIGYHLSSIVGYLSFSAMQNKPGL